MPFEAVDIYELAEDIVYHLQPSAEKKQISLVLEGEHVAVRGIRQVLYEMFYNIADNAIRYTDAGGTVRVFAGQEGHHPDLFRRMNRDVFFERFYRVDHSSDRGTGLGLLL